MVFWRCVLPENRLALSFAFGRGWCLHWLCLGTGCNFFPEGCLQSIPVTHDFLGGTGEPLRALLVAPNENEEQPQTSAPATPAQPSSDPAVKRLKTSQATLSKQVRDTDSKCEELSTELRSVNTQPTYVVGKKAHQPDPREKSHAPYLWSARCGWKYGASKFHRSNAAENPCKKRFPETSVLAETDQSVKTSSGESSSDSSSSSSD